MQKDHPAGATCTAPATSDRFQTGGVLLVSLCHFVKVLLVSLIGAPIMLLGFIWIDGWLRFIALTATGFTLLSTTPVMLALVQEHSVSSPAAANGFFMMVSFLARSAVVIVVGFLGDIIGLHTTYLAAAALGFAGIPFIVMLPAGISPRRS